MKRAAFLLCLLAAGLCVAQDTAQRVTYRTRAVPANRALEELGKLTGVRLETNPQTEGDILVIAAENTPLSELMKRIATATAGRWDPVEGGYKLIADSVARDKEARDEAARRIEATRKAIAKRVQQMEKKPEPGTEGEKGRVEIGVSSDRGGFANLAGAGPAQRAITRLLQSVDPAAIANVGAGERVVFASRPTRMQRSLGGTSGKVVAEFVAEHNKTVGDKAKEAGDLDEKVATGEVPSFIGNLVASQTRPIPGPPAKTLLVVSRMPFFNMMNVEMKLYGAAGETLYSTMTQLQAEEMEALVRAASGTAVEGTTPIELSPDSKAYLETFSGVGGGGAGLTIKASPEFRAKLFRPDLHDPLSFLPSDALLALAKHHRKPLVASVPDSMLSVVSLLRQGKETVESFEKDLREGQTATLASDEGWLLVRPAEPAKARTSRTDRSALAGLLLTVEEKGVPSLDDIAAYALKNPSPMEGGVGGTYVTLLAPGVMQFNMNGFTSWEMLRLYGALSPGQRQALRAGQRIGIGSLPPIARAQVEHLVYGALGNLDVERPGAPQEDQPIWMKMFMGGSKDYRDEPTEALPNGIPRDAYVEVKATGEPVGLAVPSDGGFSGGSALMGPEEIATLRWLKESMAGQPFASQIPQPDRVRLGTRTVLDFAFRLAPGLAVRQTLNDNHVPKDGRIVSASELPADFQKRVAERMEALKKSPLGAIGALMGRQATPPP